MLVHSPATIARLDRAAELGHLSDEIATLSAHLEAATARLLDLIREFDDLGGWKDGYASCAQWLAWRAGIDANTARERVRVARALGRLPNLAQAFARGELSYAKVRALTRIAAPDTEERLMNVALAPRPITWSASCAAGAGWTARWRCRRQRCATGAEPSTFTRPRTAWWLSVAGWNPKWARSSSRR
jgi:hypothetical protein